MESFNLREWRKANGYTQGQLAERFGVSRWTIARMEQGQDISPPWVRLACIALEMDDCNA